MEIEIGHYIKFYNCYISFVNKHDLLNKYFSRSLDINLNDSDITNISKIFFSFFEVNDTLDRLEDISTFIKWTPRTKDMKSRYKLLQYHLENHYQELYILRERIIAFLNIVSRIFTNDFFYNELLKKSSYARTIFKKQFQKYTTLRSTHVHSNRMNIDEIIKINQISYLLSKSIDYSKEATYAMFNKDYNKLKNEWTIELENRTQDAYRIINNAFSFINPIIIGTDGNLLIPKS